MSFQKNKRLIPPFYKLDAAVNAVKSLHSFSADKHVSNTDVPVHFVRVGEEKETDQPAILFIHGSPGSWEGWAEYLHDSELRSKAFMVAVDRPGYGGSDEGVSGASLEAQASAIVNAMRTAFPDRKKWILVGHSYGGPVALRLLSDYPQNVSKTFLLAPAISPALIRIRLYNKLADVPIIRSLLPTPLNRSNDEMFLLADETLKMQSNLKNIQLPVTVIQGGKDGIVDPDNAEYAEEMLVKAPVEKIALPKRGHFLPWEEYDLIKKLLIEAL